MQRTCTTPYAHKATSTQNRISVPKTPALNIRFYCDANALYITHPYSDSWRHTIGPEWFRVADSAAPASTIQLTLIARNRSSHKRCNLPVCRTVHWTVMSIDRTRSRRKSACVRRSRSRNNSRTTTTDTTATPARCSHTNAVGSNQSRWMMKARARVRKHNHRGAVDFPHARTFLWKMPYGSTVYVLHMVREHVRRTLSHERSHANGPTNERISTMFTLCAAHVNLFSRWDLARTHVCVQLPYFVNCRMWFEFGTNKKNCKNVMQWFLE